ncbi:MAG: hypothetical protein SFX18_05030 [Pirellulales bacterium]|nr:hypothetical protein [Pirellulales bacterium]
MINHLYPLALWAQSPSPRASQIQTAFGDWLSPWGVAVICLVMALLAGVLFALRWWQQRSEGRAAYYDPAGLLVELCQSHGFNKLEVLAMQQLAGVTQAQPPAALFLMPELWPPKITQPELASYRQTLEQLRGRIFAGLAGDQVDSPG